MVRRLHPASARWRGDDGHDPDGAFVLGVCGSAALYVLSYLPLGVASEFRYVYWAVLASAAGAWRYWSRCPAARPADSCATMIERAAKGA